ncbi:MAG: ribonuclease III [Desulfotomaculum sp.]|nr:ribonuclease III [Desulfotomaculum sp.]
MVNNKLNFTNQPLENAHLLSPVVLAYIGDAVYEVAVRRFLIAGGITKANKLHCQAIKFVQAKAQAKVILALEDFLTEEELNVVRRGRNAKSNQVPKGAEMMEYRYSTAFESLIGYLYLKGDTGRLNQILQLIGDLGN